jgi:hypothetical protein
MWRLVHGFGLPLTIKVHSYRFTCQEVLLISLMRLAYRIDDDDEEEDSSDDDGGDDV